MKKFVVIFLLLFVFVSVVFAEGESVKVETKGCDSTINIGIITDPGCSYTLKGLRFNLFYGNADIVKGLSSGMINKSNVFTGAESGIVNFSEREFNGLRSGFVSFANKYTGVDTAFIINTKDLTGSSVAFVNNTQKALGVTGGFIAITEDVTGSVFGFVNAGKKVHGMQEGFINLADEVNGYQGGFINVAGKVSGIMMGFINVADEIDGINLGTINIIKGGFVKISLYATVDTLYNVALKSGKEYYGILGAGYDHRDSSYSEKYKVTTGFGYHADFESFFIDYECLSSFVVPTIDQEFDDEFQYENINEFRVLCGINVGVVELFAGPSMKVIYDKDGEYSFGVDGALGINILL